MKKLICLAVVMLVVAVCSGRVRYYSDQSTGYEGNAAADYVGNTVTKRGMFSTFDELVDYVKTDSISMFDTEELFKVRYIEKLSKEESFLIWSALNEYDYEDGDLYAVTVDPPELWGVLGWRLFGVCITNNGKSFKWVGIEIVER